MRKRLSELRQKHKGDQAFGKAIKTAGLDGIDAKSRSDAIWFYENKDMCQNSDTSSPDAALASF